MLQDQAIERKKNEGNIMIKKRYSALIILIIILGAIFATYRCFIVSTSLVGTGESQVSPNGQYEATAYEWHQESFWGEKKTWFKFSLSKVDSKAVLQALETTPIKGPYFGSRSSHKVVKWHESSTAVNFEFPNTTITFNVE